MSLPRHLALVAGGLALLVGGWLGLRQIDWHAEAASSPDVARLQALATSACICARTKGEASEGACWKEYKAAIADLDVSGVASACEPISTELDCITTAAGEKCIVTGHGNGICTAEEANAADRAWTQALQAEGDFGTLGDEARARATKRADAAFSDIVERIRRGERIAPSSGPGSCG